MSSEQAGRDAAMVGTDRMGQEGVAGGGPDAPPEVIEFIRYCYRRRGIGWPELYDEMCAVAARGSYRGMGYDELAGLGIGFSLAQLPRLADLARAVVTEERRAARAAGGGPSVPGLAALPALG